MGELSRAQITEIFHTLRAVMEDQRAYLIELDVAMGDGDLGLTMARAFTTADDFVKESDEEDLGKLLMQVGMAISKAAPSTMGTLVATGFMRGGKAVSGKSGLEAKDLAAFFRAFADGIRERGKTELGNKTILDVMEPAAVAAEKAASEPGADPASVVDVAYTSAQQGWEDAKGMQAQHGRQAYYREKSIGMPDPGATAGLLIIEAMRTALQGTA
ncbi:MAG: dihydroxyacetone kinase subunit L [Spirochaetaceae bacterium]|nr:MAG: dihydroxyacetone kinase subunit L [Spirochaetaceae bacterium]